MTPLSMTTTHSAFLMILVILLLVDHLKKVNARFFIEAKNPIKVLLEEIPPQMPFVTKFRGVTRYYEKNYIAKAAKTHWKKIGLRSLLTFGKLSFIWIRKMMAINQPSRVFDLNYKFLWIEKMVVGSSLELSG